MIASGMARNLRKGELRKIGRCLLTALLLNSCASTGETSEEAAPPVTHPLPSHAIDRAIVQAGLLLQGGRLVEGVETLREVLESVDDREPIYRRIAKGLLDLGELDSARLYVDRALSQRRNLQNLILSVTIGIAREDDPGRTLEESREILTLDPESRVGWNLRLYLANHDTPEEAIPLYERGIALLGEDVAKSWTLYRLYLRAEDPAGAVGAMRRIIRIDPSPAASAHYMATLLDAGLTEEARIELDRLLMTLDPRSLTEFVTTLTDASTRRDARGDNRVLDPLFDHILALSHLYTTPGRLLYSTARASLRGGREEVVDSLVTVLRSRTLLDREDWVQLAELAVEEGIYRVAISITERLLQENETLEAPLHVTLGKAYFGAGRLEEALASFGQSSEEEIRWYDADHYATGSIVVARAHAMAGNRGDALRAFQRAVELYPGDIAVVKPFARFLADEGIQSAYGLTIVRRVLTETGDDPDLLESYARLALNGNEHQLAERVLRALLPNGLTPFGYETLGSTSLQRRDTAGALGYWREGLNLLESGSYRDDQTIPEAAGRRVRTERALREKIQQYGEEK